MSIDVRTEDGNVTSINQAIVSGVSVSASTTDGVTAVVNTQFAPPPSGAATVTVRWNAYDATGNLTAGGSIALALRKSSAGTLVVAGTSTPVAAFGDAALDADTTVTAGVSASNTLQLTFSQGAYANPVTWVAVLETGASQA